MVRQFCLKCMEVYDMEDNTQCACKNCGADYKYSVSYWDWCRMDSKQRESLLGNKSGTGVNSAEQIKRGSVAGVSSARETLATMETPEEYEKRQYALLKETEKEVDQELAKIVNDIETKKSFDKWSVAVLWILCIVCCVTYFVTHVLILLVLGIAIPAYGYYHNYCMDKEKEKWHLQCVKMVEEEERKVRSTEKTPREVVEQNIIEYREYYEQLKAEADSAIPIVNILKGKTNLSHLQKFDADEEHFKTLAYCEESARKIRRQEAEEWKEKFQGRKGTYSMISDIESIRDALRSAGKIVGREDLIDLMNMDLLELHKQVFFHAGNSNSENYTVIEIGALLFGNDLDVDEFLSYYDRLPVQWRIPPFLEYLSSIDFKLDGLFNGRFSGVMAYLYISWIEYLCGFKIDPGNMRGSILEAIVMDELGPYMNGWGTGSD